MLQYSCKVCQCYTCMSLFNAYMRDILPFHVPQLVKSDPFTVIYLTHTQSSSFLVKHSLSTSTRCLTLFWVRGVPQENCSWKLCNKSFWSRSINTQKFIEISQIFTKLSYDNVCQMALLGIKGLTGWLLPRCCLGSWDALLAFAVVERLTTMNIWTVQWDKI